MMSDVRPIPDAALDHHVAVVGKTGSGKSYAAQGIAELLIHNKARVCIIDPTDRYWGLRLRADGKSESGFEPVIFGGQYADLPLSAAHGAAIAETVGTTTTPVIIATRLLTVGERTRFFTDFAETLLRKNNGPLHLVIDEAHLFMPQAGARVGRAAPAMLHAGNNLVSLGRGIGLRIVLLSQRPAKLHKDALTQVETLVSFRLIAPQDRNAIREWVREWADEANSDCGPVICYRADHDRWQPLFTGPDYGAGPSFDYDRYPGKYVVWAADLEREDTPWRSPIHMPRWASRITLEVKAVKIEPLQDITEEDAEAEGCRPSYPFTNDSTARRDFRTLWRELHGRSSWDTNPEVVAISFLREIAAWKANEMRKLRLRQAMVEDDA